LAIERLTDNSPFEHGEFLTDDARRCHLRIGARRNAGEARSPRLVRECLARRPGYVVWEVFREAQRGDALYGPRIDDVDGRNIDGHEFWTRLRSKVEEFNRAPGVARARIRRSDMNVGVEV
jgi:hypothetical protein